MDEFLRFWIFLPRSGIRFPRLAIISRFKRSHVSPGMFRVKKGERKMANDVTFEAASPTGGGPLKQVEERRCNGAPINAPAAKLPN